MLFLKTISCTAMGLIFALAVWTFYSENNSQVPKPIRLMGLVMLQNIFSLLDRAIISNWIENPYWQFFL